MDNSDINLQDQVNIDNLPLSKMQRALLITDGSITRLLEVFSNAPVGVRTICQKVIPAPSEAAENLNILPGDEVNYREVDLYNKNNQEILIHAISYAPLSRLPENAIMRLMKEDEPIGYIMRDEMMESRREILSVNKVLPDQNGYKFYKNQPNISYFSRLYRIIHDNHPIFLIKEMMPEDLFSERQSVEIRTPSRLHIGLIDMNGSSGRVDGGAGITLDNPGFHITISESESFSLTSSNPDIKHSITSIINRLKINGLYIPPVHIHVHNSIPFHCGLGSGTQIALGIAAGISAFQEDPRSDDELISLSGRGGTSGIGSKAFFHGGLLVDAGHSYGPGKKKSSFSPSSASSDAGTAPLIGRYEIPEEWKFVLAIPEGFSEIHGEYEKNIFQQYCPVPLHDVQVLSHLLLMKLIPSVIEHDLDAFGESINDMQKYGFKKCELNFQPPIIHSLIDEMRNAGASGVGMSSFGPVVYGICDTGSSDVISAAEDIMDTFNGGKTILTKGRNRGADIIPHAL